MTVGHVLYLHGFASSPASSKARWLSRALAAQGVAMNCPDFNHPDFETLTVTRMLGQARAAVKAAPARPVALIGSSLGGFVALLTAAAEREDAVDRLVLMAPALDFGGNRLRDLGGQGIAEWKARGHLSVFHHADGVMRDVGFGLYEDAASYDAWAVHLSIPTLVFQGRRDASVDPEMVGRWASTRPSVTLRLLDDDHQLLGSLDTMWLEIEAFLDLPRTTGQSS